MAKEAGKAARDKRISKAELLELAALRLAEARILLAAGQPSGAYYLAGYTVELQLKARIADQFASGMIPDPDFVKQVFTHRLLSLVNLAQLSNQLKQAQERSPDFDGHWATVAEWDEQSRYRFVTPTRASRLLTAIEDRNHGVQAWLATYC